MSDKPYTPQLFSPIENYIPTKRYLDTNGEQFGIDEFNNIYKLNKETFKWDYSDSETIRLYENVKALEAKADREAFLQILDASIRMVGITVSINDVEKIVAIYNCVKTYGENTTVGDLKKAVAV